MVQNNDTMLKVSRLLATGLEIQVANTKFSVALATSWSQFRTPIWPFYLKSGMEMLCLFPEQIELVEIKLGTGCYSRIEGRE